MFRITAFFFFALFSNSLFAQDAIEKEGIYDVFEQFKSAIVQNRIPQAAALLDSGTVAYHSRLCKRIKTAGAKQMDTLPLFDRFIILLLRHSSDKSSLLKLDAPNLIERLLWQEMSIRLETLGDVTVRGNTATGIRIGNGEPTRYVHYFFKEDTDWKISRRGSIEVFNEVIRAEIAESKKSDNDYLVERVERQTGKKISPNVWLPLSKWK